MGLFSNNKKPCPLCGNPTPRLLATKVEDMPLCKECAGKIDLPDGALDRMTLAQLEQYMAFYEENAALRETFSEDYRYGFGLLSGALVVDSAHRLLRIKTVYEIYVIVLVCIHNALFRRNTVFNFTRKF